MIEPTETSKITATISEVAKVTKEHEANKEKDAAVAKRRSTSTEKDASESKFDTVNNR